MCLESIQWLQSLKDRLQNVASKDEMETEQSLELTDLCQGFEKFEDVADMVRDLIKTVKVLITFEITNGVDKELLVPNYNILPIQNEILTFRSNRFIGI